MTYKLKSGSKIKEVDIWTWLTYALLLIAAGFGLFLAVRNSQTLRCDELGEDHMGRKTCIIRIEE